VTANGGIPDPAYGGLPPRHRGGGKRGDLRREVALLAEPAAGTASLRSDSVSFILLLHFSFSFLEHFLAGFFFGCC
jgi:hypothetical protein